MTLSPKITMEIRQPYDETEWFCSFRRCKNVDISRIMVWLALLGNVTLYDEDDDEDEVGYRYSMFISKADFEMFQEAFPQLVYEFP